MGDNPPVVGVRGGEGADRPDGDRGAHLILVGLPGAGKSTVSALVAARLGAAFVDLDAEVERRTGRPVRQIFEEDGESGFRRLEHALTVELASAPPLILATGGGWMSQPGLKALLRPPARIIHLDVSAATAVARMGADVTNRPLLKGDDPVGRLSQMARDRADAYAAADAVFDTETLSLQELVDQVAVLATAWRVGVG